MEKLPHASADAGFSNEPVIGASGIIAPPPSYFPRLREICDRHGILLIADEVITGFGRAGKWFAPRHWGIEPDFRSFAKGITSFYLPLGGVMVSKAIHQPIQDAPMDEKFMHAAPYSGRPVCCAVGLANNDTREHEGLVEQAEIMGDRVPRRSEHAAVSARGGGGARHRHARRDRTDRGQGQQKTALGLGAKVVAEAGKRGLIMRRRGGADGPPASGDSLCLASPLMTPEVTLQRIIQIVGDPIAAVA